MKKKDRVLAFAGGKDHVLVASSVLREKIILAGRQSKVESRRHVVYRGAEIMILLKALRQGVTSEQFRRIHELKRIFQGTMRYSESDEKLHKISLRAEDAKRLREMPKSPRQRWVDRVRAQPPRRPSTRPALP